MPRSRSRGRRRGNKARAHRRRHSQRYTVHPAKPYARPNVMVPVGKGPLTAPALKSAAAPGEIELHKGAAYQRQGDGSLKRLPDEVHAHLVEAARQGLREE